MIEIVQNKTQGVTHDQRKHSPFMEPVKIFKKLSRQNLVFQFKENTDSPN